MIKIWGKTEESGTLAQPGLWGWLRPCKLRLRIFETGRTSWYLHLISVVFLRLAGSFYKIIYKKLTVGSCFMTSLWRYIFDICIYFGMNGKKRPTAIRRMGVSFQVFTGGGNHLVNRVTEKGLVRRGLRAGKRHFQKRHRS